MVTSKNAPDQAPPQAPEGLSLESVRQMAIALAKANGHTDPDAYASEVVDNFRNQAPTGG